MFLDQTLPERLEERGVSRRAFLQFCGVMATTLALPASYRTTIAEALGQVRRPVLTGGSFRTVPVTRSRSCARRTRTSRR